MTTCECRKEASAILKKNYPESFFIVMSALSAFVLLKILDIAQTGFLLYNSNMGSDKLFVSSFFWEAALKIGTAALFLIVMTPLFTGGLWWFYQTASGNDNREVLKLYTSFSLNVRACFLYLTMWALTLLALLPSFLCFRAACYFYGKAALSADQALTLFTALQIFMAGVFLLGLYLRCVSKLFLAPFIFITHPDMNIFRIIRSSGKAIYGSKLECIKLMITYIPLMLPIVTIPFVLPRAVMSLSVFAKDRIGGIN